MDATRSRPRSRLVIALKMLVAFGLLAAVLVLNREPIREVLSHPLDARLFALGFGAYLAGMLLSYVRWYVFVRTLGIAVRVVDALRIGLIANLFNFVIPGGPVGGDVVRAAFLCRERPDAKGQAIASVAIDRLIGLLGLFVLACLAGTAAWGSLDAHVHRLVGFAWGTVAVVTGLLVFAFTPSLYRPLLERVKRTKRRRLAKVLSELVAMGTAYRSRPWVVILGLAMAMVTHSLIILAFFAVSRAMFPTGPALAEHVVIVPLVLFSTAVPLPFGALGLSEGLSGHLFHAVRYQGGAVAMLGFRVLQYGTAALSALVYVGSLSRVKGLKGAVERMEEGDALIASADAPGR